jgi:nucleoside-diphosphate-sugar epimerase
MGDPQQRAFNPYGLAKHISHEVLRMEAHHAGVGLAKFVIPNPFGPHEDMRFTSFLAREWAAGRAPCVQTPDYVRDNIPVSLLALNYAALIARLPAQGGMLHAAPAGYVESQGLFARRLARAIAPRTGWACALDMAHQREFPEPLIRVNPDSAALAHPDWDENAAWDALAAYYLAMTAAG